MIEYLVITCDTNHTNRRVERLTANDIDTAAIAAIHAQRDRFVVAVIEADHAPDVAALLADSGAQDAASARRERVTRAYGYTPKELAN